MSQFRDAVAVVDEKAYEAAEGVKGAVIAADEFAGEKMEAASSWVEKSILEIRLALRTATDDWQCLARKQRPEARESESLQPERFEEWELDEQIVCTVPGPFAQPWHPSQQPNVCKLCLLGEASAGKSSIIRRLVSRAFEERHDPTARVRQHFWRHNELLVELEVRRIILHPETASSHHEHHMHNTQQRTSAPSASPNLNASAPPHLRTSAPPHLRTLQDCPGLPVAGEDLTAEGRRALEVLLEPPLWYEAQRREVVIFEHRRKAEQQRRRKQQRVGLGFGRAGGPRPGRTAPPESIRHLIEQEPEPELEEAQSLASRLGSFGGRFVGKHGGHGDGGHGGGGGGGAMSNPIGTERKRNGFVVVADLSRPGSLHAACEVVDRIFDRLMFNRDDTIRCPVAVVVAGCKSDLRASTPGLPTEATMRQQVEARYENFDQRVFNVTYAECSAITGKGVEALLLHAVARAHAVPHRAQIESASHYNSAGQRKSVDRILLEKHYNSAKRRQVA